MRSTVLLVAAAPLLAAASPAAAPADQRDENVLIISVTPDPGVGSGILAVAVEFVGVARGERRSYLIPYMRPGQPGPHVGQRCDVTWQWSFPGFQWLLAGGRSIDGGREVRDFHCAARSPSP